MLQSAKFQSASKHSPYQRPIPQKASLKRSRHRPLSVCLAAEHIATHVGYELVKVCPTLHNDFDELIHATLSRPALHRMKPPLSGRFDADKIPVRRQQCQTEFGQCPSDS
jgi:hypothetical protein